MAFVRRRSIPPRSVDAFYRDLTITPKYKPETLCYVDSVSDPLEPTESYDGRVIVHLLDDSGTEERIPCSSFTEAIAVVKDKQHAVTVAKIVDRDDEVVFSSADMEIDVWEKVWKNEKRRLSVNVEAYECPYDSISCFADDLCIECQIDKVQNQ